jgi:hypothetical protein
MSKKDIQDLPEMKGPGVAPIQIPALDKLARKFLIAKEEHEAAKDTLEVAKVELQAALEEHADELGRDAEGAVRYYCGDVAITMAPGKTKITVTAQADMEDPDNENN